MSDKLEFFYNGKWSSELGVYIGGTGGYSITSLKPPKIIKTEEVLGVHGLRVTNVEYAPRTIPPIPIYIESIDNIDEISAWLECLEPSDFYFNDDTQKVKAIYDNAIDIEHFLNGNSTEIKFIAYDPYKYAINDKLLKFTTGFSSITFYNDGSKTSFPLINIKGTGDILFYLNGTQSFTVKGVVGEVNIDSIYGTCYKGESNLINQYSGDIIQLLPGKNVISLNGTVTEVSIQCRSRWI